MRSVLRAMILLGCGLLAVGPTAAQREAPPPAPETLVQRACDAAGGFEAFKSLGVVVVAFQSEEVSQDGGVTSMLRTDYVLTPGPTPGRTEIPALKVVAADDGTAGWALINQKPDMRFTTTYKVKRELTTSLFPIMLPFSLTWQGVGFHEVRAAKVDGRPVWQLTIEVPKTFFENPQIATTWTVSFDRNTFAVVRADSPFTDLGKGITADGMRFTWRDAIRIGGVTFPKEQKVTGLDEVGQEKIHNRLDHLQYHLVPASEATKLFANPIPPDQRPKRPPLQQYPPR